LEQHKPKHSKIYRGGETDTTFDSNSSAEQVVILPPEEELRSQTDQRKSFAVSVLMRISALLFGVQIGVFFVSHYSPNPIKNFSTALAATPILKIEVLQIGLALVGLVYFAWSIYRYAMRDRGLSTEALLSNITWLIIKPIVIYLMWTFVFFIFSALGASWFSFIAGCWIALSSYDSKFHDRRKSRPNFRITSFGG
jgi:hypothetical protein